MLIVSEQQTFNKLRIAPADFAALLDSDPEKALEYITQLQGERETVKERKAKAPKDPNASKSTRGKKQSPPDFSKLG